MRFYLQSIPKSCTIFAIVTLLGSLSSFAQTITGTVFRDFNSDGAYTAIPATGSYSYGEPGVSGVIVTAYNANGIAVSTVTSATTGAYSLTGLTTGQAYRVEFTSLQTGDYEGFRTPTALGNNATSVQFVSTGATNVNFGINYPTDYCQATPPLSVPCYVSGNPLATGSNIANEHVLITVPYASSGATVTASSLANANQIGSVFGTAYQRETKKLFTAAFLKRHVGLGPAGLGGIYVTTIASTTTTATYVDLENAPFNLNLGQSVIAGRTLPSGGTTSSTDPTAFSAVGTVGLGGLALSTDGKILYAVDLYNRQLLALAIGNPAKSTFTAADLTQIPLPNPGCANGVARPFAVTIQNGKVYIGVVCTGENGGTASNLFAHIYAMAEGAATVPTTPIFSFRLNYTKGRVHMGDATLGSAWETWANTFNQIHIGDESDLGPRAARVQPMLTDITFADNGDMILSFTDRGGHQLGYKQRNTTDNGNSPTLYNGYIGGDILRAHYSGTSWILENNGTVGSLTSTGDNNSQGPGTPTSTTYTSPSGEFFFGEDYSTIHQETSMGSGLSVPGLNQTVATVMDPLAVFTGGFAWFNNRTGDDDRRAQIYETGTVDVTFGKANGLGLIKALCNPAPIEIGNRVWRDDNNNGIQDPGEPGIGGVRVTLTGTGLTAPVSVTTNAAGEYYFTNTTGTPATGFAYSLSLTPGGSYSLTFPTSYSTYNLSTKPNSATGTNPDNIDTDASAAGVIGLTLGQSGANNYSFDVGFVPCIPPVITFTASSSAICQGAPVTLTTTATPTGTYSYTITAPNGVTLSSTNSASAIATGLAAGVNTFTVTVSNSPTCSTTATVSVTVSAAPLISLSATQPTICVGQTVTLNVLGATLGSTIHLGVLGGLGSLLGVVTTTPVSPTVTTTYSVTAISPLVGLQGGCPSVAQTTIVVNPLPALDVMITSVACNSATNQYTLSGMVSLTNAQASALTITDGAVSTTIAIAANATEVSFTLPAQASGGTSHVVMASLPGCTTANSAIMSTATYTSPISCTVGTPLLTLDKRVSNSVANVGSTLTYTIILSNVGTAAATNVVVTDSSSTGLRYVTNSATAPAGTTFTQGTPRSTWAVGTLAAGQSLTLTFQAIADSAGILYNKAIIPGNTVSVCTSVPYRVCANERYVFNLTAPVGRSSYRWFRTFNGVTTELTSFTANVLAVTAAGSYSLAVDNATGACPDFSCCPFIIEEDSVPVFAARAIPVTCTGNTPQTNGQLVLSNFRTGNTYQYSLGATFNAAASLSGAAQIIPVNGLIATNLANPATAQTYTIRVYNAAGCFTDATVMLMPTVCSCPTDSCVPFVITQIRRPVRIGDPR